MKQKIERCDEGISISNKIKEREELKRQKEQIAQEQSELSRKKEQDRIIQEQVEIKRQQERIAQELAELNSQKEQEQITKGPAKPPFSEHRELLAKARALLKHQEEQEQLAKVQAEAELKRKQEKIAQVLHAEDIEGIDLGTKLKRKQEQIAQVPLAELKRQKEQEKHAQKQEVLTFIGQLEPLIGLLGGYGSPIAIVKYFDVLSVGYYWWAFFIGFVFTYGFLNVFFRLFFKDLESNGTKELLISFFGGFAIYFIFDNYFDNLNIGYYWMAFFISFVISLFLFPYILILFGKYNK